MCGFELYWTLIYFSFYTYWCASNSAFTPVIGITSSAQGLKIYVITAELKKYEEIIKKNEKKHDKIVLLAKSKSAWISKSQVDICELLVASWYQKLELVINEWVCPLFWVLYYTLTSWKLEFALFLCQNYNLSYDFHELFMSRKSYFVRFYELLKVPGTSNFTLWHILRIKVSYNIFITPTIPVYSRCQNIMWDRKIIKID